MGHLYRCVIRFRDASVYVWARDQDYVTAYVNPVRHLRSLQYWQNFEEGTGNVVVPWGDSTWQEWAEDGATAGGSEAVTEDTTPVTADDATTRLRYVIPPPYFPCPSHSFKTCLYFLL